MQMNTAVTRSQEAILSTNKVIKIHLYPVVDDAAVQCFRCIFRCYYGNWHGASLVASIAGIGCSGLFYHGLLILLPVFLCCSRITGLLGFGLGPIAQLLPGG